MLNNPTEGTDSHKETEQSEYKRPDLIIIDQPQEKKEENSTQPNSSDQIGEQSPISLRFLCVLGLIFCLVFGIGMLLWSMVLIVLAVFSLFRNTSLNQSLRTFGKICVSTIVAGLCFTLGILSPTLGLGLLVLYFSLTGEMIDNSLLRKILRRSFDNL